MEAARRVKIDGKPNDLLERVLADETFGMSREELDGILDIPSFVGRAPQQTREFMETVVRPLLEKGRSYGTADDAAVTV
jgi:adenylosuccinate lyase